MESDIRKDPQFTERYKQCPACNGERELEFSDHRAIIFTCIECDAVFGVFFDLAECEAIVIREWAPEWALDDNDQHRYFDFYGLEQSMNQTYPTRIHGWYHRKTKKIIQEG